MIYLKLSNISRPLAALCGLVLCGASAHAADYHYTEISPLADQSPTYPAALNATAHVAGTSGEVAFHYVNGMKEELGSLLGGKMSRAYSINNLADVVGDSTFDDSGIRHATFFTKVAAIDLGTLATSGPAEYSVARQVNDSREVVGFVGGTTLDSDSTQAFLWTQADGMRPLGTLGGHYSQALAISNTRFITGSAQLTNESFVRHAFIWKTKGGMRDLGTLASGHPIVGLGSESSCGTAINDAGHVVGYSGHDESNQRVRAFLHNGKSMIDLGSLKATESDTSAAFGINAKDEVVGTSYGNKVGGELVPLAFLYKDGVMYDLNTLVDLSAAPYQLQSATAINDAGQIVVQAINLETSEIRGLLLTPNTLNTPRRR
jgi:probable HAF family extracellular repeat protein